ncbi:hypothetical protein ACIBG8_09065 [Nonomuraea sp. NPDC050556]|uniref:hypothetical protein n=1 Tax=Nonomuraea sp. NPDC050556 TaxID=3364369 RepID=UPI003791795E
MFDYPAECGGRQPGRGRGGQPGDGEQHDASGAGGGRLGGQPIKSRAQRGHVEGVRAALVQGQRHGQAGQVDQAGQDQKAQPAFGELLAQFVQEPAYVGSQPLRPNARIRATCSSA